MPSAPAEGTVLAGKLRVARLLGAGGVGAVYEIVHELSHRRHSALAERAIRGLLRVLAGSLCALAPACADEPASPTQPEPARDGGSSGCAPGSRTLDDGRCQAAGIADNGCAAGFESDGARSCRALLPPEPCADGLMATPGETTCREVASCGDAQWGAIPVEAGAQFVDAAYTGADADGSPAKPWKSIQQALAAATPGALVAVAAGTYPADLDVEKPVRLWGRCPAMVEIVGSASGTAAIYVGKGGGGTEIHDVAVRGEAMGVFVSGAEGVALDRVWIHVTSARGLNVQDESSAASASASVRGSLIEHTGQIGAFLGGATVTLDATVVRDTQPEGADFGQGIACSIDPSTGRRATVTVSSSVVELSREVGIRVKACDLTLEASVVRDTLLRSDGTFGRGVEVRDDPATAERGSLTMRGSVVERSHEIGIAVIGSDAAVESTVIRDTEPVQDQRFGRGLSVQTDRDTGERSIVTLSSSVVEHSLEHAVLVNGSEATLEGCLLRATGPQASDQAFGRAITAQDDAVLDLRSTLAVRWSSIEDSYEVGVAVLGSDATVEGTAVARVLPRQSDGFAGDGLVVEAFAHQATLTLEGSRVEHCARAGLANFGAAASVENTAFECNAIDLDGEDAKEAFSFDDRGGNVCGCEGATSGCKVLSSNLEPPAPLP